MWRMKVTVVSVAMLSALLFGAAVAYAGWGWNAKVDIGGTKVSMSWTVTDDVNGAADYQAEIMLEVPSNVDVNVVKVAPSENLTWDHNDELQCSDGEIDALISYFVTGDGNGSNVAVSVDRVGGGGQWNYGSASGPVGTLVSLPVTIAGQCQQLEE